MDQGLKERLVGAAVLVAIGVWLIPWVLNGPDSTVESEPASLQLPAAEEPVPIRTQTLRLDDADAASPEPSTTTETVVAAASPAVEPPPPAAPAQPAPVAKAAPVEQAPTEGPAKTAAPTTPKPAPVATTAKPAAAAPTSAKGDWTVQLGSFSEEANAHRLAERASTFGYRAAVSSVRTGGKTLYRVRVGAYDAKTQAEATASALAAHGLTAKVVPAN